MEVGSIRFNTDTANLEYYRGKTIGWSQFDLIDPDLGGGTGSNTGLGTRALFAGGLGPDLKSEVDYITISTLGNTQAFGNLGGGKQAQGGMGSRTRAVFSGGFTSGFENGIKFFTFEATESSTTFNVPKTLLLIH